MYNKRIFISLQFDKKITSNNFFLFRYYTIYMRYEDYTKIAKVENVFL